MSETSKPRWSITAAKYSRCKTSQQPLPSLSLAPRAHAYRGPARQGETAEHSTGLVPTGKESKMTSFSKRRGVAIATLLACMSLGATQASLAAGGGGGGGGGAAGGAAEPAGAVSNKPTLRPGVVV